MNAFPPVIDGAISNKPFLLKHPNDLLLEEKQKIPLMTGINYDEGLIKTAGEQMVDLCDFSPFWNTNLISFSSLFFHFSAAFFNDPALFLDLARKFNFAAPIIFYYDHYKPSERNAITDKIKEFYFHGGLKKDNLFNVTNVRFLSFGFAPN